MADYNAIDNIQINIGEQSNKIIPHDLDNINIQITENIKNLVWKNRFENFPQIDLSDIKKPQIELYLCKPNKTVISTLKEAYDITLNVKVLQLSQLEFKLPLQIDSHNTLINNPNIDLIRYRYLIKVVLNNSYNNSEYIEYYRIKGPVTEASEEADYKKFTCYSLVDELSDRLISSYDVVSFSLDEIFNGGKDPTKNNRFIPGVLSNTNWKIAPGGISAKLTLRRRSINITGETTLLNFILNNIVEIFNVLPIFNTLTREIYIFSPEEVGKVIDDDILRVSYRKYLQTMGLKQDDAEFTTRLRVKGKDNLSLHTVIPTGQRYLENFSFFLYGYEEDEYGNVLSSSPYWSDELSHAQLAYQTKLEQMTEDFNILLEEQLILENERLALEIEAFDLLTMLYFVQDVIDVLQGLDKGIYRFRNEYDEEITVPENITYTADLNVSWYYYLMCKIPSLDNLIVKVNGVDITNNLTSNSWYHNTIFKYYGIESLEIELIGNTNQDISFDICRILQDEYYADGTVEIQIVFLGGVAANNWRLGKPNPLWIEGSEEEEEFLWTNDLPYNISAETVLTELQTLYNEMNITVRKAGSMADGTVYFEITFPHSLGEESGLVGDFSELPEDSYPFIIQKQGMMTLLEKYNEELRQIAYNEKMEEIVSKRQEIYAVEQEILVIKVELSLDNNFTTAEIEERNNFIIEKVYQNNNITNATDLLEASIEYFNEVNKPGLLLNIQLANFLEMTESYMDYNKIFYNPVQTGLYDIMIVKHEKHNINVECMILEINYNFETSDINFVVSNVRELLDPETKFLKDLYSSTVAATTLLTEKYKWDGATETVTELDQILNQTWDAAERAINSGVDNSVRIDNRGIRITNPNDPLQVIALVAGWLGISSDGGTTYKTVLNADGIAAKYLIGQIILGRELHVIGEDGKISFDNEGISIKDNDGNDRIKLTREEILLKSNVNAGQSSLMITDHGIIIDNEDGSATVSISGSDGNVEISDSGIIVKKATEAGPLVKITPFEFSLQGFGNYVTINDDGIIIKKRDSAAEIVTITPDGFSINSFDNNVQLNENGLTIVGNDYTAQLLADQFSISSVTGTNSVEITNEGITVKENNQLRVKLGYIGNVI